MTNDREFVQKVRKLSAERQAQERAEALTEQQAARAAEREAAEAAAERVRRAHEIYGSVASRLAELAPLVARQAVATGLAPTVACQPTRWVNKLWGSGKKAVPNGPVVRGWTIADLKSSSYSEYDSPHSSSSSLRLVLGVDGHLYQYWWRYTAGWGGSSSSESIARIAFAEFVSWALANGVVGKLGEIEADLTEFAVRNALW
ncbi:hypothetical protein Vqi01_59490 [Micromonospora qiuiae]|uniref:Uncharacterized protein n=1 Tax=Micromonospora qiuiae TaxID=502268 RepID=A0ABQ4JMR2_9ACTN|nr:hypothetical protein [Micromonospora qiuiae]GIJ30787.1 hypothetical protein Vqi01_59490 [Micromonospora qiuiae]